MWEQRTVWCSKCGTKYNTDCTRLWYNGVQALSFTNLELRTSSALASIGGLYFSTFFGGDDTTWASPTDQYTYFRNMQLYGGFGAYNGTGASGSKSAAGRAVVQGWAVGIAAMVALALGLGAI